MSDMRRQRWREQFVASEIELSGRDSFKANLDRIARPGQVITMSVGRHTLIGMVERSETSGACFGKIVRKGIR